MSFKVKDVIPLKKQDPLKGGDLYKALFHLMLQVSQIRTPGFKRIGLVFYRIGSFKRVWIIGYKNRS
jgi:hypothetical protein